MTKEEAFKIARDDETFNAKGFSLLEMIYDDFENKMRAKDKEIKELKSKIPKELSYEEKLQLVPLYGNAILED